MDSRPGINNRPPFGDNTGNRGIAGNRTNIGQGNIGQGNISNRQNNFVNRPVDPGYGVRPPAYNNWRGQYWDNHRSWVNGYWHGYHNTNNWNWGSFALGAASGVAAWGLGASLYSWGYAGYSNPYYDAGAMAVAPVGAVETQGAPAAALTYDYSQPINPEALPPEQPVTDAALAMFDSARASFKAGHYAEALQLTEQALNKLPNDATLHEFRGLCLFALGKFDQAAVPLYAVLSVGPGWDWTTLAGLYPSVDVYSQQLRNLEAYTKSNSSSAAGHFVLGYFYLTQGSVDQAVNEFQKVVSLSPSDTLSAQLVKQFSRPVETPPAPPTPPSAPQNVTITESNLPGNWKARPTKETTISLKIQDSGVFTWEVTTKGQTQQIAGDWSLAGNVLTLAENEQKGALIGNVSSQAPNSFVFRVIGAGPPDSGLSFTR